MSSNKAFKNALHNRQTTNLPYGFEQRMMRRITMEAEKRKKRAFVMGLGAISFISAAMIAATVYVLKYYLSFSMHVSMPDLVVSSEAKSLFVACSYIALLILLLLGMDAYFRKLRQKRHSKSSAE
ncbi:hypothetical protein [Microbacter margulisiae]|uniref:Uncharacterized protein n=1 Tax=Microbacter margulisiae TaxID=1350067 RepID=A0A7W5H2N5_9PORP|nr:hypothetical protein [Microbacter margulisiae]MBB3187641.1 hypothetical protein [Microbacter margulisiae]